MESISLALKTAKNSNFCILGFSTKENSILINGNPKVNANHCFVIKFNEKSGFYTIMALHSHLFLGVNKSEPFNLISQHSMSRDFLLEWDIIQIDDNCYTLELKGTDLMLEYNQEIQKPHLSKATKNSNQLFIIKTIPIIKNGIYHICAKFDISLIISFPKDSKNEASSLTEYSKNIYGDFYIQFDPHDGCYSIINSNTYFSFSSDKNSKKRSFLYLKKYRNSDDQKWIISSFDISNGKFFFELKSNLLRLEAQKINSKKMASLQLSDFKINQPNYSNQLFKLIPLKILKEQQKSYEKMVGDITKIQDNVYLKEVPVSDDIIEIDDDLFSNFYFIEILLLPDTIKKISKNAFKNSKLIKCVICHPKWLNCLPNPLNIESVYVNDGTEVIKKTNFAKFRNLKVLVLPESLKYIEPKSFENIGDLRVFVGNLNFINHVNKTSLTEVKIPNYIITIPEETFSGCHYLKYVEFKEGSKLETIESRAFAYCTSLIPFKLPNTVKNIAPDAFFGCDKINIPEIKDENQRLSMIDNLIINENVKVITEDYSLFVNISSLEIPLSVKEIEENVFDSFIRLKYVKCDPKWLLKFPNSKIEIIFVPNGIKEIKKKYFVNMIHLNFIEIPESVDLIDENAFENCNELTSFKCGTKHLNFLDKKKIKSLIFNNEVKVADKSHFDELVNLETLALPEKIEIKDHSIFSNCKKLITINNPYYEKYTTFRCIIGAGTKKIKRKMFEGWTNLKILSIPESVTEIEEDSFKDCTNLKYLSCDPKWFNLFYKFPISNIYVPDFVTEISKGQFDSFLFLSCIRLPKNIAIDDPSIFDECESLTFIDADLNLLATLSNKTKKRCNWTDKKTEYSKPIFGGEQDTVINKTLQQQKKDENGNDKGQKDENVFIEEEEEKDIKETTIDDLVEFDQYNEKYAHLIKNILQDIETLNDYEPKNTNLSEISKVCTVICHKINKSYKIIPRPVQLLVVLRLADDILNNKKSHGSISEIKTGEGKSLIITILTIILVIFKRKVDIVSSNMELVKRDQKEQKKFFDLFGIETGVFYNKNSDIDFMASIRNFFNSGGGLHIFKDFTNNVLDYPVVYSTNTNYESLYLKSIFSMNPRQREYDVVLVDEVDNMFIDEFSSPLLIANEIDYAYINDILQIVFILRSLKASEVIKFLEYFFPNIGIFELENIEMLQDAANRACNLKNKVDYIVQNGNIIIIDPNTGFKKLNSRWNNYIHEMVEIKEGLEPQKSTVSFCQITQNGYFNLYKKIAGVTGTIGSPGDEEILKKGYKVQTFKVPRHFRSKMKVIIKNRPKSIEQVFNSVCDEIIQERNKGRPVLVIWDSIKNAEDFLNKKPYIFAQQIIGIKPELDRKSIENAGTPETVTIATLAAGRGVDIKLTKESLEAGGLHVIIPMPMSSQRALDQAAGRAGRQGQPGSVTFYTSENDKFRKPIEFSKGDDNLVKLELMFSKYLRSNFPWMLQGPGLNGFNGNIFPFAASPSIVLRILARRIAFVIKRNPFSEINERFQDLALQMVQLAWGIFFSSLCDNVESCEDWDLVEDLYNDFLKELNYWFDPIKSHTANGAVWYIRGILIKEIDWEYVIVNGIKITSLCLCVVFPAAAPTIILVSGVVLSGGQEIYHQLQNGQKINWIQVLIRVGGSLVRSAIMIKFGIGSNKLDIVFYSAFRSKAPDMVIHFIETMLCQKVEREDDAADADLEWEDSLNDELSKSITLSINISATTQDTNKWIYHNVKQKKKKPKNLIKFKPRNYPAILNIEFIRMAMKLANDVYDFKASIGKIIFKCYENDLYKPVFHCIEDSKNLFVVIRGSNSKIDWETDFCCWSTKINLNGVDVYFHSGFYNAAIYVLDKIRHILENTKKTIYLIGHSYAASVSSVMIYLLKSQKKFLNRTIYTLAFAPAPAMSSCPPEISRLIFAFINRDDFVTSLSCFNALNSAVKARFGSKRIFLKKNLTTIKAFKQSWTEVLVATAFDHFDDILREMDFPKVKCVKGTIFKIGVGKKKRLIECRIKESQLPTTLSITMISFSDHLMNEYIKSFKRIET